MSATALLVAMLVLQGVVVAVVLVPPLRRKLATPTVPTVPAALAAPDAVIDLPAARAVDDTLPVDLEVLALSESEPWARDDVRAALRDRYLERRSWDRVRADLFIPHGSDA